MAELAQPAGDHGRAHAFGVEQHDPRALDAHPLIGGLHELTARRMHDSLSGATDPKAALVTFVGGLSSSQTRALRGLLGEAESRRRK